MMRYYPNHHLPDAVIVEYNLLQVLYFVTGEPSLLINLASDLASFV